MSSVHALATHQIPNEPVAGKAGAAAFHLTPASRAAAQETYYIEDGWVFREHHGKFVECICRTEELSTTGNNLLVFQLR